MDFIFRRKEFTHLEKDFQIFEPLLKKRPEISPDKLKHDLTSYYLPFIKKLIELKDKKATSEGLIVGISAIQGAGKTTQGEILEVLLKHFGYSSISRSIDDHYITHRELCELRGKDPRFIRRGVTHDIPLAILNLRDLQKMGEGEVIIVSGYDKGVHKGDGDRFRWVNPEIESTIKYKVLREELVVNKKLEEVLALSLEELLYKETKVFLPKNMGSDVPVIEHFLPIELVNFLENQKEITITAEDEENIKFSANSEIIVPKKILPNGWRIISKKPDFIFYEGWMLGARKVQDESVFDSNLPALETEEARQFARDVNKKLENYDPLWQVLEFMNVLYVENYMMSLKWRDQAEEALRAKGEGMTHEEIKEFVYYFWRSVHPGIHIRALASDKVHVNQVVIINDDHSIGKVLTP